MYGRTSDLKKYTLMLTLPLHLARSASRSTSIASSYKPREMTHLNRDSECLYGPHQPSSAPHPTVPCLTCLSARSINRQPIIPPVHHTLLLFKVTIRDGLSRRDTKYRFAHPKIRVCHGFEICIRDEVCSGPTTIISMLVGSREYVLRKACHATEKGDVRDGGDGDGVGDRDG